MNIQYRWSLSGIQNTKPVGGKTHVADVIWSVSPGMMGKTRPSAAPTANATNGSSTGGGSGCSSGGGHSNKRGSKFFKLFSCLSNNSSGAPDPSQTELITPPPSSSSPTTKLPPSSASPTTTHKPPDSQQPQPSPTSQPSPTRLQAEMDNPAVPASTPTPTHDSPQRSMVRNYTCSSTGSMVLTEAAGSGGGGKVPHSPSPSSSSFPSHHRPFLVTPHSLILLTSLLLFLCYFAVACGRVVFS